MVYSQCMECTNQQNIQLLLHRKLMEFRAVNPSFSMRALAKRIGMQPSATNEILKGQRQISAKLAERIANNLLLDPSERAELMASFPTRPAPKKAKIDSSKDAIKLNSIQFQLISDPIHFAILSLIKTKDFKMDHAWMAQRLNKSLREIEKAIDNLNQLKLIEIKDGRYQRTVNRINTPDGILDISIQKSHLQDMDAAREKIQKVPVHLRDFTSYTLPADPGKLAKAREIIRRAQDQIDDLMGEDDCAEVYKICTYFYPLTDVSGWSSKNE